MTFITNNKRRHFLRQMSGLFAAGGAYATLGQLGMMNQALAMGGGSGGGYRALVCIYLAGGNDSYNLFIPTDTARYDQYADMRSNLAIPQNDLLGVTPNSGGDYGFHPSCGGLRDLFNAGDLAVVTNMGTLVAPMDKTEYSNGSVPRPPQLFSHNSQTDLWQTGSAIEGVPQGWGGLMADQLVAMNGNQTLPLSISLGGSNLFGVGNVTSPYQIGSQGLIEVNGFATQQNSTERQAAFDELFAAAYAHPFQRKYQDIMNQSVELEELLTAALDANPIATAFPDTSLGNQLEMVARLIAARVATNQTRQIFFVRLGGFDTHNNQNNAQPNLYTQLSEAITAFQTAMGPTDVNVANQVTTFTMSEFARTMNSNGDGSDHAWGGQQIVIGGDVLGQELYGTYPTLELDGVDSVGRGRMIPTTAVDQFGATLASWMELGNNEINAIFPNLNEFGSTNLGFLA